MDEVLEFRGLHSSHTGVLLARNCWSILEQNLHAITSAEFTFATAAEYSAASVRGIPLSGRARATQDARGVVRDATRGETQRVWLRRDALPFGDMALLNCVTK